MFYNSFSLSSVSVIQATSISVEFECSELNCKWYIPVCLHVSQFLLV